MTNNDFMATGLLHTALSAVSTLEEQQRWMKGLWTLNIFIELARDPSSTEEPKAYEARDILSRMCEAGGENFRINLLAEAQLKRCVYLDEFRKGAGAATLNKPSSRDGEDVVAAVMDAAKREALTNSRRTVSTGDVLVALVSETPESETVLGSVLGFHKIVRADIRAAR